MKRPDGKHTVTVILTEQEIKLLQLIMEQTYRYTMSDCIRAMINETGKNFLPMLSDTSNNTTTRTKRATTNN